MNPRRPTDKLNREEQLLRAALGRRETFESESLERLTRVEENLRLLRQDLLGNGQPGRLGRLEFDLHDLRTESQRQRGILAGISAIVSTAIALLSQFFLH
jgi:hypothetical protein